MKSSHPLPLMLSHLPSPSLPSGVSSFCRGKLGSGGLSAFGQGCTCSKQETPKCHVPELRSLARPNRHWSSSLPETQPWGPGTRRQAYQTDHQNPTHLLCPWIYRPALSNFLLSLCLTLRYHQPWMSTASSAKGTARGSHACPGNDFISSTSSGKTKTNPNPRSRIIVALLFMDLKLYCFMNFNVQSIFFLLILH